MKKIVYLLAAVALILSVPVKAVQLGVPEIISKPNQALVAEIRLSSAEGERITDVKIADELTFGAVNMPFGPFLRSLTLKLVDRNDQKVIRLTSTMVPKVPSVGMVLEFRSDRGWGAKTVVLSGMIPESDSASVARESEKPAPAARVPVPSRDLEKPAAVQTPFSNIEKNEVFIKLQHKFALLEQQIATLSAMSAQQDKLIAEATNSLRATSEASIGKTVKDATDKQAHDFAASQAKLASQIAFLSVPWYARMTRIEICVAGVGLTLFAFLLLNAFIRKVPVVAIGDSHKIRIIGIGNYPIEGEFIRGDQEILVNLDGAVARFSLLQRLGLILMHKKAALKAPEKPEAAAESEVAATDIAEVIPTRHIPLHNRVRSIPHAVALGSRMVING